VRSIDEYLIAAGAIEVKEVRPFLWQFRLPGDNVAAGRATTTRDGQVRIWHRGSRAGLELAEHWRVSTPVALDPDRSVPSYVARLDDLKPGEKIAKRIPPQQRYISSDAEVESAAIQVLESYGWKREGRGRGIHYLNDGNGSTPACRLSVKNGIASVWTFRGDVDLPAPWRPGRALPTGEQTMYATAKDLGVAALSTVAHTPELPSTPSRPPIDKALAEQIVGWWKQGEPAPSDHRHLTKSGVTLQGTDLRLAPPFDSPYLGDLIVPLLRPVDGEKIEVAGGQRLCATPQLGTDKLIIPGSRLADSFVPIPLSPLLESDRPSIDKWIQSLDGGKALKDRPLVVCEGVATALAIYESGAGYPIAAISSGNIGNVAKWLSENGHTANFPDFVIAADYDIGIRNGKLASQAIKKALDAATECGAKVAIPPPGSSVGADARDLYASGAKAVCDYIATAQPPGEASQRQDIWEILNHCRESGVER